MNSTRPSNLANKALRALALALLALASAAPALAGDVAAAPSSGVPFEKALADATRVAGMHQSWSVVLAKGESMVPQFGSSSILLVDTVKFEQLKPGMLVVYTDRDGDLVAHRLVAQNDTGWTAKGLNNDKQDPGVVTAQNLRGVVFGIFNYKSGSEKLAAASTTTPVAHAKKY